MRLACRWERVGSKLRNSEKMLAGRGNRARSVRRNIRCCGQVLSALCQLCSESGHVVTPTCYWIAAVAATTGFISVWSAGLWYCKSSTRATGHKVLRFFFYVVCCSMSSLGLIYNVITLLQMGRIYNLSTDTTGAKRIWITHCYLNTYEITIGKNKYWLVLSLFRSLMFKLLVFLLSIHCVGFVQSFSLASRQELYIT